MEDYITREEAYERVSMAFPKPISETSKVKKSTQPFALCDDRTQLIENILSIISQNGSIPFKNRHYKLVFSVGCRDEGEYSDLFSEADMKITFVTLVATNAQGVIVAKLGPGSDSVNRDVALENFKEMVRRKMHELLRNIPQMDLGNDHEAHEILKVDFSGDDEPPLKRARGIAEKLE